VSLASAANTAKGLAVNFQEAIEFSLALPDMERFNTGSGARSMLLETMKSILSALGDPHTGRGTMHVTGSKGKGSTSTFINALLHASGFSTSLYTSPHLEGYTERVCFDLENISERDFAAGVTAVRETIEHQHAFNGPVSTFGALTAMFFYLTREKGCQWQVVEVGLGGSHDATNVFEAKDTAVITAISLEHTAALGKTPEEIAHHKSGIITLGCHAIVAPQRHDGARAVIEERCREVGAHLIDVATLYKTTLLECTESSQFFRIKGPHGAYELSTLMRGRHQLDNATTALAAVEHALGAAVAPDIAVRAFATAMLPGRLEVMRHAPLTVIDGAHNPDSARVLSQGLIDHFPHRKVILVLGVNSDKDVSGFLKAFQPAPVRVIATASNNLKAMSPYDVCQSALAAGLSANAYDSVEAALMRASEECTEDALICVAGSLYVAGEARTLLRTAVPVLNVNGAVNL
jgi:dihydrofolate synthase/folylpolyglutamate synthase